MFKRARRQHDYVRRILVSTEGSVTEPQYLFLFERAFLANRVRFDILSETGRGDPGHVLDRMQSRLDRTALRRGDEAWLVVDKDRWTDEQLRPLTEWAAGPSPGVRRRLLVSNPNFELWLLLHFEPVRKGTTAREIAGRLGTLLPGYDKSVPREILVQDRIRAAIANATALAPPSSPDWPRTTGTTVHEALASLLRPTP